MNMEKSLWVRRIREKKKSYVEHLLEKVMQLEKEEKVKWAIRVSQHLNIANLLNI